MPSFLKHFLLFLFVSLSYGEFSSLSLQSGLTLEQPAYANRFVGLGHAGMAYIQKSGLSLKNPSKLAFNKTTSIEAQFNTSFVNLNTNNKNQTFFSTDLSNVGLVVKLGSWGVLAASYQQRFSANYSQIIIDEKSEFLKTGQIFEAGIIYALDIHPRFSIGVALYSLSGEIKTLFKKKFDNPLILNFNDTLSDFYNGSRLNFSSTFRTFDWNIALSGDLPISLDHKQSHSFPNQKSSSNLTKDTSFSTPPLRYAIGGNWKFSKNKNLVLDFTLTYWSPKITQVNQKLFPHIGIGYEYSGNLNPFTQFYKRLLYRFGLGYEQIHNHKTNVYRITAGIGIPIQRESILDFNIEAGLRKWKNTSNTNEQYLKLLFSFVGLSRIGN